MGLIPLPVNAEMLLLTKADSYDTAASPLSEKEWHIKVRF